ncbi:MAG: LysM peptidoglycan-binding domain-containing protein [Caldilinea sp.]|uniref:LysM peptidoglycan-binding domain-containing protein n=1 Tax=Caldilinea sp. TaxID=2293560 RepID=UPI00309961A8
MLWLGGSAVIAQTETPPISPLSPDACPPAEQWLQYIARPGDRWASIAERFHVDEGALRRANPTPLGSLLIGQPVRIPCIPAPPTSTLLPTLATAPVPPSPTLSAPQRPVSCTAPSGWVPYTVQRGDTLSGLASLCRTSVAAILQANGCRSGSVIYAGETLRLPCMPLRPTPTDLSSSGGSGEQPAIPSLITSPGGGTLDVRVSLAGRRLTVTIADAGSFERLSLTLSSPAGAQSLSTTATQRGGGRASFTIANPLPGWYRVSVSGSMGSEGEGAYHLRPTEAPASPTRSVAPAPSPQRTLSAGGEPAPAPSPATVPPGGDASQQEDPSQSAPAVTSSPESPAVRPTPTATALVEETPAAPHTPTSAPQTPVLPSTPTAATPAATEEAPPPSVEP